MLFFKRVYVISFVLFWMYVIYYPLINRVFDLQVKYKPNIDLTCNHIFVSALPVLNTFVLIYFVNQDINIYRVNKSFKKK